MMGGLRRRGMRIGLRRGRFPREVKRPARGENALLGVVVEGRIMSIAGWCTCGRIRKRGKGDYERSLIAPNPGQKQKQQAVRDSVSFGVVELERECRWPYSPLAVCGSGGQTVWQAEPGRDPAVFRRPLGDSLAESA